jgi:hypothetical protein
MQAMPFTESGITLYQQAVAAASAMRLLHALQNDRMLLGNSPD